MTGPLTAAIEAADLQALIVEHCGHEAVRGLHPARGGVIRDPRPGHEERNPSFSVYRAGPVWRYKRYGGDEASGTAYDFLLAMGYSASQAREELLRRAGLADAAPWTAPRPAPVRIDPLAQVRAHLSTCSPLSLEELDRLPRLVAPLHSTDPAALDLARRGLWPLKDAGKLRRDFRTPDGRLLAATGALTLQIPGPEGQPWALKVRNPDMPELSRYVYRIAGHGNPAWCSPDYGQAEAVLLVEGELNGAAASVAARHAGLSLDVQGLASAGGVPHLEGLAGRPVYLYFDGDEAGRAGAARVATLARDVGAKVVRVLASLAGDLDCCDLLGERGPVAFGAWLRAALESSVEACTTSAPPHQPHGASPSRPCTIAPNPREWCGGASPADPVAAVLGRYQNKLNRKLRGLR